MVRAAGVIVGSVMTLLPVGVFVGEVEAQTHAVAAEELTRPRTLRVTDARLSDALTFLVTASVTADRAFGDLRRSRLPVTIGTPAQLAELTESDGGPSEDERTTLLAATSVPGRNPDGGGVAWVMFRSEESDEERRNGWINHVWLAIEADSVEAWIRRAGGPGADERIHHDFLAILAHEFVAHIGSIAASRRMQDLCDDPTAEQRARSAAARAAGRSDPLDGDLAACALQVENRVRTEVNDLLASEGMTLLPLRSSYSLEALHFEQARRRLYPPPARRLRPLMPIRN